MARLTRVVHSQILSSFCADLLCFQTAPNDTSRSDPDNLSPKTGGDYTTFDNQPQPPRAKKMKARDSALLRKAATLPHHLPTLCMSLLRQTNNESINALQPEHSVATATHLCPYTSSFCSVSGCVEKPLDLNYRDKPARAVHPCRSPHFCWLP